MEIARRIREVSLNPHALAVADKIDACSRVGNVWVGNDLHNSAGELYEGTGRLFECWERVCPGAQAARSRKARARARAAIKRVVAVAGNRWQFITLTMPTLPASEVSLLETFKAMDRAWRLFRKRSWWTRTVQAGVKGVEFTLGDENKREAEQREWEPERDGYHVHMHLLVLSGWVNWRTLREEWSDCLLTAWGESGIERGINTSDGLAVCHVTSVTDRRANHKTISAEAAISEVAKYVTKSDSWLKVPGAQLAEIAAVTKWPRMFELLGDCREKKPRRKSTAQPKTTETTEQLASNVTIEERLAALHDDGSKEATLLWQQGRAELSVLLSIEPETLNQIHHATRYLDTQHLFAAWNVRDGPIVDRKPRSESLTTLGARLIEGGESEKWRQLLAAHVAGVQEFRRVQQSCRYPFAKFTSLDGGHWYGLRTNPASSDAPAREKWFWRASAGRHSESTPNAVGWLADTLRESASRKADQEVSAA